MTGVVRKRSYYDGAGIPPELARRYFRLLGDLATILDLGCGTGELGRYAPKGVRVHGVDMDAGAVELASRYEHAICLNLENNVLPYEDGMFDAVVAKDVFEHVTDAGRLAAEARRVVAPGGKLLASVIMAKPKAVWSDYTHVRGFTKASAVMLLEDAGLTVDGIWRMGPVPLSSKLHLMDAVPHVLRLPIAGRLWATSWELIAHVPK